MAINCNVWTRFYLDSNKVYFNTDYIFDDKEIVKFFTCDNGIMVRCFKIESLSVKEKNIQ